MKIEGTYRIEAPRERVFAALTDPGVLEKCIPGCERLEKAAENQYNARLSAGVGPVKGVFTATVSMRDVVAPERYTLVVEGKGQPGFVKGSGELSLADDAGGTSIRYTGEVNIGGTLAGVGQRMLQATANMLASRFFSALGNEVRMRQASAH